VGQNFNISENGFYGRDAIGLGGRGGPTLDDQIVGGIATEKHYLGMFGVNSQSTDFNLNGEQPSYIASLKNQNIIPSLSFGYTAGAQYRESCLARGVGNALYNSNSRIDEGSRQLNVRGLRRVSLYTE
jgi:hypothetical protein